MQNTVYECKQNGADFILLLAVTNIRFGNRPANGLVTEQPQYSVAICIFHIKQNTETSLISNDLRSNFTYSLFLALPITFHQRRHTFATMELTMGADLYTTSKLLGHTEVRTTQIYAKIINKKKDEAVSLLDSAFEE